MTVRILRPGDSAESGTGWVMVVADLDRGADGVELRIRETSGAWHQPASSRSTNGRREIVLGTVDQPLEVVVRPSAGSRDAAFAHGSTARLRIVVRGEAEGDEFVCAPVNLSGLLSTVLATLAPAGQALRVALPEAPFRPEPPPGAGARGAGAAPAPAAVAQSELGGLSGAAQTAARRVVGHRPRLAEEETREIHVVLDRSASMLQHLRSGAVADVLAVYQGLNAVVGAAEVEIHAVSTPSEAREAVSLGAGPSGPVARSLFGKVYTGFATSFLPAEMTFDRAAAVYLVTDAEPADRDELLQLLGDRSPVDGGVAWHLVVLDEGDRSVPTGAADPRGARRDRRAPTEPGLLAVTTLTPPLGHSGTQGRVNPRLLEFVEWALAWAPEAT